MTDIEKTLKDLIKALEAGNYGATPHSKLANFLAKFNIKSAQKRYSGYGQGAPLIVEDLQSTIDAATFDMAKILLHKDLK